MNKPRKAVVLAAGKGTRLRTEGVDLPKVMRQAAGRPLLEHVLSAISFLPSGQGRRQSRQVSYAFK